MFFVTTQRMKVLPSSSVRSALIGINTNAGYSLSPSHLSDQLSVCRSRGESKSDLSGVFSLSRWRWLENSSHLSGKAIYLPGIFGKMRMMMMMKVMK